MRVKCLAQEHNAMTPARARTRAAQLGDERTNHEATVAPSKCSTRIILGILQSFLHFLKAEDALNSCLK